MTRRKVFDPAVVTADFWHGAEVRYALEHRDVGRLFDLYLRAHPDCTQTQLALLTEHDRSDISNWVRGVRQPRVSNIAVLTRIADGLRMPDEARVLVGLAPAGPPGPPLHRVRSVTAVTAAGRDEGIPEPPAERRSRTCIAICGSRSPGTDVAVIDSVVRALAKLVMLHGHEVHHGPIGVGIEVMTYIADHFRPPGFTVAVGRFGRPNVVRDASYVLVVGGGSGTQDEIDVALVMGKKLIPMPASGGAARRFYEQAAGDPLVGSWMPQETLRSLGTCGNGDGFSRIVDYLMATDTGVTSD